MKPTMKALRTVLKALSLLVVIGSCGLLEADPSEATITSPTGPITIAPNQTVTFTASSKDSGRNDSYQVDSYQWNFGDGTATVMGSGPSGAANHTYANPGVYTATLTVTYTVGRCTRPAFPSGCMEYSYDTLTATATRTITVLGPPTISSFSASPASVRAGAGQPVTLSWVTANATSLSISGVGAVTGTSVVVYPTAATTYTLTASNAVGSATASTPVNTYSVTVAINPTSASLLLGGAQTFTATVNPPNQGVSWSATGGSMSGGTFTGTSPGTFTVTATSLEDSSKSASATVTVASAAVGTPAPANATVNAGSTVQYSAAVSGAVNTGVNWSVNGGGTISASGLFSATTEGTYTVTATSVADGTKSASTPVTVASVVTAVSVNPPTASLAAGETNTFTATVSGQGGASQAVTWIATGGAITTGGVYTAPIAAGTYTITATSTQDSTKKGTAQVTVAAISVATPSPANATVNAGSTLQYSATVTGGVNTSVNWSVSGGGTISASGLFSATTAGTYTVTATSAADGTKSASTLVTVASVVTGVSVNPPTASLLAGETKTFTATISGQGGPSQAVTWSATGGAITTGGMYTAPIAAGTYTITATSTQDSTKKGTAQVTVVAVVVATPTPANATVTGGNTLQYSATVTGAANPAVTWSVTGGGTISTSGLFSATTAGTFSVKATSVADPTKSASTNVTVQSSIVVVGTPAPANATVNAGTTRQYSATVTGTTNTAVTWSVTGGGTISTSGLFSATTAGTFSVKATSVADPTKSASTNVTVNSVVTSVAVSPSTASLAKGEVKAFTATVMGQGGPSTAVTWSATGGTITTGGVYTAPATAGTYTVTATSTQDSTKKGTATVTVTTAAIAVGTPSPANATVNAGTTRQYSATVTGTTNTAVTWSVTGGGTISTSGLFSATTAGTFSVKATSVADPTKSASTNVTVKAVVTGVAVSPSTASLAKGEVKTFTATVSGVGGPSQAVTWSATGGTITTGGVYTAPATSGTYTVTATSTLDTTKKGTATVTVTTATIAVAAPSPANATVNAGTTRQYSATVTGTTNTAVTWSVTGGGTISTSGLFSATTAGTFSVKATSVANPTKSASTNVTVKAVVTGVTVNPATAALKAGEARTFTATVSGVGGPSQTVTWSATGGTITTAGVYTAPIAAGTYTVTATSTLDTTKKGTATVTVTPITVSTPSPANATVNAGSTQQYSATVSGAANTAVTWSVTGGGTISTSGLFTATTAGTFTVKAASAADPTQSASTGVTVKAVVTGVTVTPATASLNGGQSVTFSATVSGTGITNPGVTWSASGGSIGTDGTFTAPNQSGSITVTASSLQDGTKTGAATVTVRGWVLKLKKDIVYVGTKEVAEVDAQGVVRVTLVDHLGSPRFLVGPTGVLESTQKYLPFGETLADPASAAKFAKGFTNHEQTDPSGLIYMQARFYAPWYGRFLSPDPARDQHFDDTQSWNIYSYCLNQPTMKFDPDGQAPLPLQTNQWQIQGMRRAGMTESQIRETMRIQAKRETVAAGIGLTLGVGAELGAGAALLNAGRSALTSITTTGAALWQGAKDLFSRGSQATQQVVNLVEHEAAGGHTIARHVGQSADQLAGRLATSNISAASSFTNLKTAEAAVGQSISANAGQISQWLSGTGQRLALSTDVGTTIGTTLQRGAQAVQNSSVVQTVLQRDPTMKEGYRIVTAYPK